MDVKFTNSVCSCLKPVLCEAAGGEQTQEIRLSDNLPDVGRVVSAWGQPILRSKEWNGDQIQCSAGMLVWVLYAPEDGSEPRIVNTWIPFQLRWDIPDGTPEGKLVFHCFARSADARSVSPRKILIRCGIRVLAQAYVPEKVMVSTLADQDAGIHLLRRRYPVRIRKEAGEKLVELDEELVLPDAAPKLEKLVYCTLEPQITENRILSDKLVFRGNMRLHALYVSSEGQLHSWDYTMPFSQYALLDENYGADAQGNLCFCVTSLEPEPREDGTLRVKCGVVCQYVITDREWLDVTEDAYSLDFELLPEWDAPELPVMLEQRTEKLSAEQTLNADTNIVPDVRFLPDYAKVRKNADTAQLQWAGIFHVLYYGIDGALHSGNVRWESEQTLPMDGNADLCAIPGIPEPQVSVGNGTIYVSAEYPVTLEASANQPITMLTGIRQGQSVKPDANRPSLILRRCGLDSLWEIAKKNGSTVDAIRKVNGIQEEPSANQMLLIPVLG